MNYISKNDDMEFSFIEVLNYLYSSRYLVISLSFAFASAVGIYTFFFQVPKYQTKTAVSVDLNARDPFDAMRYANPWGMDTESKSKLSVAGALFRSRKFKWALYNEIYVNPELTSEEPEARKYREYIKKYYDNKKFKTKSDLIDKVSGNLRSIIDENENLIEIEAVTSDPALSASLSNIAALTLIKLNHKFLVKEIKSVEEFIKKQTSKVKLSIDNLEQKRLTLQKSEKFLSMDNVSSKIDLEKIRNDAVIDKLSADVAANTMLSAELSDSISQFKEKIKRGGEESFLYMQQVQRRIDLLRYRHALRGKTRAVASQSSDDMQSEIKKSITEFDTLFDHKKGDFISTNPWDYLKSLEKTLIKVQDEQKVAKSKLVAHENMRLEKDKRFSTFPQILKKLSEYSRDISVTSKLYSELKEKLQEAQIQKAGKANDLVIMLFSEPPGSPTGLSIYKKFILGIIGGGVVCLLILILRYLLIPTVRSTTDLKRIGMEVIGEVPYWKHESIKIASNTEMNYDHPLILDGLPDSYEANALRHARFNLQEKLHLQSIREKDADAIVVSVCSANSYEGKSFLVSNLSYSLAASQFRTLVIDLDISKPSVKKYFGLKDEHRDDDLISGDIHLDKSTYSAFLDIVSAKVFNANSIDLLESPFLHDYIGSMKKQYDLIIIDTAPLRNSMEGLIASSHSDAVVFVTNQRQSLRHDVVRSYESLRKTFNKPIYSILNFAYDELSKNLRRVS